MASVNKVIIVGNLGKDPEVRAFSNGSQVVNVSVATTEKWKDKQTGLQKELTEWHRVTFQDGLATIAAQYLRKGSAVYIEGSLRTRKWVDQSGVDRYVTEIRANQMQMLGGRQSESVSGDIPGEYEPQYQPATPPARAAAAPAPRPTYSAPKASSGFDDMDDDIPF